MEASSRPRRLGLIINPIAGMGGALALKGTDGAADEAIRLGAQPRAESRAAHALSLLRGSSFELLTVAGVMGEYAARSVGLSPELITEPAAFRTTAADTQRAALAMLSAGVDLLLFAGGDGTSRDIFQVVRERLPMLGIPAGVKMHSAVFATSPAHAGEVARRYLENSQSVPVGSAEVTDRDVTPSGRVSPRLYGFARSPHLSMLTQYAKSTIRAGDESVLRTACRQAAALAQDGLVTIIGPGTTTRMVKQFLGFAGTLDGVDVVRHGRPVALDVSESRILRELGCVNQRRTSESLASATIASVLSPRARIIISFVGGQGCLFGRGNQQISAEVIRRVGRDNIVVVAGRTKLLALPEQCLFVDTDDSEIDALLSGYIHVWTGARERVVYRVEGGNTSVLAS